MATDEAARLAALHQYAILDTAEEPGFDDLTAIASTICGTPISLLTLVDAERQWFKSRRGLSITETARDVAFCSHAIEQHGVLVVSDALADERFRDNPLVVGEPHIRFYAGMPIRTPDGHALGTLCVIDHLIRTLSPAQLAALAALARQAEAQLELRRSLAEARSLATHLQAERERAERRSESQKVITTLLARASTIDEAIPDFLRSVADLLAWDVAALWLHDPAGSTLRCRAGWQRPGANLDRFLAQTQAMTFARGVGIPGRVWQDGRPVWIADVTGEPNFPRRAAAVDGGLHAAFAVPVVRHDATRAGSPSAGAEVVGVVEFFSSEIREPDRDLLNMFGSLGSQFGEFLERIEALEALRDSEHKMRRMIDTSIDGVISIDGEGRIVDWNPQAELVFGWSRDEAAGQDLAQMIIPADHREGHRRGMARYHETGSGPVLRQRLEMEAVHRDGRVFPIELSIAALRPWQTAAPDDARGALATPRRAGAMFSGFVRDISERRRTETALRLARDQAETTARARADFLATMSHEIRTPLNGVIGMLRLALKTSLSESQHEQLNIARQSADLLLSVANDVLDLSRIEAGRLTTEQTPFDLRALIEDVVQMLRLQVAPGVKLSVAYEGPEPIGVVLGDPLRLSQILLNVVGNAVKFTRRGHVLLRVQVPVAGAEGSVPWRFVVEDTGIGIPEDKQSVIFDAFTQADRSTTRQFGGTGLGLPIAARLARLMDGTLQLLRSSEDGSVFELTLPLPPAEPASAADAPASPSRRVCGRVLVVDDNHVNRTIAEAMLGLAGCTVELAEHGREAVKRIQEAPYDLVLMDCQMPEMDGYEATKLVRQMEGSRALLPIVAMTVSALPEDRARCLAAGMNDHISKPLLEEPLMDALVKWLPLDHGARADAEAAALDDGGALDLDHVRRLRKAMKGGAWQETMARFIADSELNMADIASAVDGGVAPTIKELAHALRGTSSMIGAARLARECAALERAAEQGQAADYEPLANQVRCELAVVVAELKAMAV